MTETALKPYTELVLPASVVTRVDIARLSRELEQVDSDATAIKARASAGVQSQPHITLSDQLTEFVQQNAINLNDAHTRSGLIKQLRVLKEKAPVIHMTFSVTADRDSLQSLAQWLRTNVHRQAVLSVGLQPALVAGVYLRTPNHVHDLSLRALLKGKHGALLAELEATSGNV